MSPMKEDVTMSQKDTSQFVATANTEEERLTRKDLILKLPKPNKDCDKVIVATFFPAGLLFVPP